MYKTQKSYKLTLLIILILVKFFDIVYIPNHIISYFAFFIVLYFTIKNCKRPTLFEKIILVYPSSDSITKSSKLLKDSTPTHESPCLQISPCLKKFKLNVESSKKMNTLLM